jgi:uncharacterized protein YgbK (DUF1537 family)
MSEISLSQITSKLPPPWSEDPLPEIREALSGQNGKLVILDDDPTGTQTVRGITVITRWDLPTLKDAFATEQNGFFILTNSRALAEADSIALHQEILANLKEAAAGIPITILSRSDSTLRGHFPAETDAIDQVCGPYDLAVISPFFEAGGRLTIGDTHYVAEDDTLVPAHETPFAQDKVFGYSQSYLPAWVEEKSKGRISSESAVSIDLNTIRSKGVDGVEALLRNAHPGSVCIVNAIVQRDMEVFAAAALRLELSGTRILYRSAAALASARLGIALQPPLEDGVGLVNTKSGGLIVAGSYVPKTTEQLEPLQALDSIEKIELDVAALLESDSETLVAELSGKVNRTLQAGQDVLLFTSRSLVSANDETSNLSIGARVSQALVQIVRNLQESPRFIIAKGGITSSDVATKGLEIRKATIIGQLIAGVPVWRSEAGSRFPQLDYVVFPGNVGGPNALLEAYQKITGSQ